MDEEIIHYARQKYNLLIGERMAEKCKIAIGSAYPLEQEQTMLPARAQPDHRPARSPSRSAASRCARRSPGPVHIISDAVRSTLDETPPELVADLMEHGIALAGGGALLQGLAQRLSEETRMRVYVAESR